MGKTSRHTYFYFSNFYFICYSCVCVHMWDACMCRWLCEQLCAHGDQRLTSVRHFSPLEGYPGIEFRCQSCIPNMIFPLHHLGDPSTHTFESQRLWPLRGFEKWAEGEAAWWVEGFTLLQQNYFRTWERRWRQENCGCSQRHCVIYFNMAACIIISATWDAETGGSQTWGQFRLSWDLNLKNK